MSDFLKDATYARLIWCDISGIRRSRVTLLPRTFTTITKACVALPYYGDECIQGSGVNAIGEYLMCADERTHQRLPWMPNHKYFHVTFQELSMDYLAYCCPRTILKNNINSLEGSEQFKLSFEIQFQIFDAEGIKISNVMSSFSDQLNEDLNLIDDMISTLTLMGIKVEYLTPGDISGQFKIGLSAEEILRATDNITYAKEAISAVARKHGKVASLLFLSPSKSIGSNCEYHLTFDQVNKNCEQFAQNILQNFSQILPFLIGSPLNFFRSLSTPFSEAPVRFSKFRNSFTVHIQMFDGTANPHLALAAIIAAGKSDNCSRGETSFNFEIQNEPKELTTDELSSMNQSFEFVPNPNYFSDTKHNEGEFQKQWEDLISRYSDAMTRISFDSELLRAKFGDQFYYLVMSVKKKEIEVFSQNRQNILQHIKDIALRY